MTLQPSPRTKHLIAFTAVLAVIVSLTFLLTEDTPPTFGDGNEAEFGIVAGEMRLTITEPADACDDTTCQIDTGNSFTLSVEIQEVPSIELFLAPPISRFELYTGYVLAQSYIAFGPNFTYSPTGAAAEEILWPDCEPATAVRSQIDNTFDLDPVTDARPPSDEVVSHGCVTGLFTTPTSFYTGPFIEITLRCDRDSRNVIELVPATTTALIGQRPPLINDLRALTNGALFNLPDPFRTQVFPKLHNLIVFCGQPPTPTTTPTITPGGPTFTPSPTAAATSTPTITPTPSPTVTPTATVISVFPCGDVNGDRLVNSQDALWVLWFASNVIAFLPFPGDVDGDGITGPLDALFILWIELNLFICR